MSKNSESVLRVSIGRAGLLQQIGSQIDCYTDALKKQTQQETECYLQEIEALRAQNALQQKKIDALIDFIGTMKKLTAPEMPAELERPNPTPRKQPERSVEVAKQKQVDVEEEEAPVLAVSLSEEEYDSTTKSHWEKVRGDDKACRQLCHFTGEQFQSLFQLVKKALSLALSSRVANRQWHSEEDPLLLLLVFLKRYEAESHMAEEFSMNTRAFGDTREQLVKLYTPPLYKHFVQRPLKLTREKEANAGDFASRFYCLFVFQ